MVEFSFSVVWRKSLLCVIQVVTEVVAEVCSERKFWRDGKCERAAFIREPSFLRHPNWTNKLVINKFLLDFWKNVKNLAKIAQFPTPQNAKTCWPNLHNVSWYEHSRVLVSVRKSRTRIAQIFAVNIVLQCSTIVLFFFLFFSIWWMK